MKKGIPVGCEFVPYACVAVKYAIFQRHKTGGTGEYRVISYEAFFKENDAIARYDFTERLCDWDELRQAVADLPEEKRRNKYIQKLISECFPQGDSD